MSIDINPETRLSDLLEAYPDLEEVVLQWAPALAGLKNPVLRKAVAESATLEQAARLGNASPADLVAGLRKLTGQHAQQPAVSSSCGGGCSHNYGPPKEPVGPAPEWVKLNSVRYSIDADQMLATGVHPIGKVRECAATLAPGESVRMTVGFRPEPLLENLRQAGFAVWCGPDGAGRHNAYFARPQA